MSTQHRPCPTCKGLGATATEYGQAQTCMTCNGTGNSLKIEPGDCGPTPTHHTLVVARDIVDFLREFGALPHNILSEAVTIATNRRLPVRITDRAGNLYATIYVDVDYTKRW